jgi:hypothetical protein
VRLVAMLKKRRPSDGVRDIVYSFRVRSTRIN